MNRKWGSISEFGWPGRYQTRWLLVIAVVVTALLQAQMASAACPEATEARKRGRFDAAETAAHTCLKTTPANVMAMFELSRAIGYQQRFDEALSWIDEALVRVPHHVDMRLFRVRLLGWMGRPDDAITVLDAMVEAQPSLMEDPETATLSTNLRLWAKTGWTARVELSPRVALARGAVAEWDTRLSAWFRASNALRIGIRGEVHERRGEATPIRDMAAYLAAAWYGDGWGLGAEAGLGVNAVAIPTSSVWVEPSVRLIDGLSTSLRYWRVDYADAGAHVITPGLRGVFGDWTVAVRYYLSFPDTDADDTAHAGLLRLGWSWSPAWRVEVGGGAGSGSDYLETTQRTTLGHVLGLVGLQWKVTDAWSVRLGYIWRRDDDGAALLDRHTAEAAVAVTL